MLAAEIKALVEAGDRDAARERFGALVALLQRRAIRIAFQYLRDAADADEAVQDAFVKVFLHIEQYRSDLPFDVWFTRILVNAALDRLKARGRQQRWISHSTDEENGRPVEQVPATEAVARAAPAREGTVGAGHRAVAALPDRQRLVFTLCHLDERTPAEISAATGMSQATVRVHLFRALRKLRGVLGRSGMSRRDISELDQNAALEAYRAAACAEADAHFDDRALETQRHKILARLAHLGHPAKVIRFPKAGHVEVPTVGVNRRWISVAAAAGLIIGLLGGQLVHLVPQRTRRLAPMATSIAPSAPVRPHIRAGVGLDRRRAARRNRARHAGPRRHRTARARRIHAARRSALSAPVAGSGVLTPRLISAIAPSCPTTRFPARLLFP